MVFSIDSCFDSFLKSSRPAPLVSPKCIDFNGCMCTCIFLELPAVNSKCSSVQILCVNIVSWASALMVLLQVHLGRMQYRVDQQWSEVHTSACSSTVLYCEWSLGLEMGTFLTRVCMALDIQPMTHATNDEILYWTNTGYLLDVRHAITIFFTYL